jgi:hypothetical protein
MSRVPHAYASAFNARNLVCHAARASSRTDLFAPGGLPWFFAQKNYRAHKPLTGMWQGGVEKPHSA